MGNKAKNWINSEAKQLLRSDIITGRVIGTMPPDEVYAMREEYKDYPFDRFKNNLKRLREAIQKGYKRVQDDCIAYSHDMTILQQRRMQVEPRLTWHRSEARKLLEEDINDGLHLTMKPRELYMNREEYQEFELKVFCNHIYQEIDSRAKKKIRFERKQKKHGNKPKLIVAAEVQQEFRRLMASAEP